MTLMYGSDLASGGWDALNNIYATIGAGPYPTTQRQKIISDTVLAAGATGQTFRPTAAENQSMIETKSWSDLGWLGSPYEDNLSVTKKVQEGQQLVAITEPQKDVIGESLDYALGVTKKITTLYDQLSQMWEPREVIKEEPRAGTPEGKDVRNLNQIVERGAEMIKAGTAWAGQIFDQVKGLFNLGFDQTGKQPAFAIKHELDPSPTITVGFGVIVALIVILMLMRKR